MVVGLRAHSVTFAADFVSHEADLTARMEHDEALVFGACLAGSVRHQQKPVTGLVVAARTHPVRDPKPRCAKTEEVERSAAVFALFVDVGSGA